MMTTPGVNISRTWWDGNTHGIATEGKALFWMLSCITLCLGCKHILPTLSEEQRQNIKWYFEYISDKTIYQDISDQGAQGQDKISQSHLVCKASLFYCTLWYPKSIGWKKLSLLPKKNHLPVITKVLLHRLEWQQIIQKNSVFFWKPIPNSCALHQNRDALASTIWEHKDQPKATPLFEDFFSWSGVNKCASRLSLILLFVVTFSQGLTATKHCFLERGIMDYFHPRLYHVMSCLISPHSICGNGDISSGTTLTDPLQRANFWRQDCFIESDKWRMIFFWDKWNLSGCFDWREISWCNSICSGLVWWKYQTTGGIWLSYFSPNGNWISNIGSCVWL